MTSEQSKSFRESMERAGFSYDKADHYPGEWPCCKDSEAKMTRLRRENARLRGWLLWLQRTAGKRELGLHDSLDAALHGDPPPQALPPKGGT